MYDFLTTEELEQRSKYINLLINGLNGSKKEAMFKQYADCSTKSLIRELNAILDDSLTYGDDETVNDILKLLY